MEIRDMVKPRPMRLSDLLIVYCYHMIPFTLMPIVNTILNYYLAYQLLGWWGPLIVTVVLFVLAVCPPYYNRSIRRRLVFLYEALAYYMKRVRYIAPKDLIPDSAYIFAFHPHGRMFYTNTMMIQTNYEWRKNFCPKGDFFAGAAAGFYSVPVLRNLLYLLGTMPASESNIRRELRKKNHMAIVIGGLKEVCLGTTSHTDKLYLMRRKGFARIAVQEKVGVIPIYCFNENQLFKHDPVWFLQFWEKVNRHINIGVPFMRGAWNLTLPFRRDLLVVVGKPLFPKEGESVDDFHARYRRRVPIAAAGGGAGLAGEQGQSQEKGEGGPSDFPPVPAGRMMVPVMKKGYGAFGGATLEKSKLDLSFSTAKTGAQVELGGGGGNIGKGIGHGGGDGGDDGGDDDDYFGEDDGDDGDDDGFIRRAVVAEVFDRASVQAVLEEWFRTMADLPAGIRRAVEMGVVSSAQVARLMSMDARPTIARFVSRIAPPELSRAFIGRMMADPAFLFKLALEQAATVATAVHWEVQQRLGQQNGQQEGQDGQDGKSKLIREWPLALTNVLTLSLCNLALVWCLSPSRSYGSTATNEWQMALQKLPNNVFDRSYALREFKLPERVGSFFFHAAQLSLIGSAVGAAGGAVSNAILKGMRGKKNAAAGASQEKEGVASGGSGEADQYQSSVAVPSPGKSAVAFGAFTGLSGNLRYQLLYGADRVLQEHFNHIPVAILGTTALRVGNILLGEPSRLSWLGLDSESVQQAQAEHRAYHRPSLAGSGKRLGSRPTLSSLLRFLGFGSSKRRVKGTVGARRRGVRKVAGKGEGEGKGGEGGGEKVGADRVVRRKVKRKVAMT
ncbi:unnamed protein product [Closterium sp. Yama58-4]|nr:unnamed protein product [Closterium sp. Yama58-4]